MEENKKRLGDCNVGDWVYYDAGKLYQVREEDPGHVSLSDGYICRWMNDDSIVYPLTLRTKCIAEVIKSYYNEMHKKNLINGSRWVNWLTDKFDFLVSLDESAGTIEYEKIYKEIEDKISELEYHKNCLE